VDIVYTFKDDELKREASSLFKIEDAYADLLKNILVKRTIVINENILDYDDMENYILQFPIVFENLKKVEQPDVLKKVKNYYNSFNSFKAHEKIDASQYEKFIISFFTQDELLSLSLTGELCDLSFLDKLDKLESSNFSNKLFTLIREDLQDDFDKFKEYVLSLEVSSYLKFIQEDLKNV
jgi:exonuclease I